MKRWLLFLAVVASVVLSALGVARLELPFSSSAPVVGSSLVQVGPNERWPLRVGSAGPRVKNLQWLLHRKRVVSPRRGIAVATLKPRPSGYYGRGTARAVRAAYWKLGWPTWFVKSRRGAQAGPLLFKVLQGKAERPLAYRIAAGKRAWRATAAKPPASLSVRQRSLVRNAKHLISVRGRVHYSQSWRMHIVRYRLAFPPLARDIWEDCSSSVTGLYWRSGLQDPNGRLGGRFYSGWGFTGTLAQNGRVVWYRGQSLAKLRPGDLIFYGRYPFGHVAMYLGGGRVFSHGSEGGPYNLPALYRSDAYYARRYS